MVEIEARQIEAGTAGSNVHAIRLRGVRVHNLKNIDLDIPLGKLVVLSGPTGSGKTSLGIHTLFVESQRRFLQGFSFATRQYLQQFEEPEFDSIDHLPPTVALVAGRTPRSRTSTAGNLCGAFDLLRNLFVKYSQLRCPDCGALINAHSVQSAMATIKAQGPDSQMTIVAPLCWESRSHLSTQLASLQQRGFLRFIIANRMWHLGRDSRDALSVAVEDQVAGWIAIDRVRSDDADERIFEALESAFLLGDEIGVLVRVPTESVAENNNQEFVNISEEWHAIRWLTRTLRCVPCGRNFFPLSSDLLTFRRKSSSCALCHGKALVASNSIGKASKTEMTAQQSRTQDVECPECLGTRLNTNDRAFEFLGYTLVEWLRAPVDMLLHRITSSKLHQQQLRELENELEPMIRRLELLQFFGLGALPLQRSVERLSHGERQRLRIVGCSASELTGLLYIFDEPTFGLDDRGVRSFVAWVKRLRDLGNTVLLITNHDAITQAADWSIELGPSSGGAGGQVMHSGHGHDPIPANSTETLSSTIQFTKQERIVPKDWLHLSKVHCKNLRDASVAFPLGCLCLVRGPSGSGKTALIVDSLLPLLRPKGKHSSRSNPGNATLTGRTQGRDVFLIDSEPIRNSQKMMVASYLGLYDDLCVLFAGLTLSKQSGLSENHFSVRHQLGACPECQGTGTMSIDMQFLTDLTIACPGCQGRRFRPEVLKATYRGMNIAQVLDLTIEDAIPFFRAQERIQKRLKKVSKFGLGYLRLAQRLNELSLGDIPRIKLASKLTHRMKHGSLFLFDQATFGLSNSEVIRFLEVLEQLVGQGHSIIAIDHHPMVARRADYIIDLAESSHTTEP